MPKWLLFGLIAAVDFVIAGFLYRSGSYVIPVVLGLGGVCFVIAAVGAARQSS